MYWAPVVPMWFSTSSSKIASVPDAKCVIMYLPTRPLELASPFGCLSVAELNRMRGFCPGGQHYDTRKLHLAFPFFNVVFDAGDACAFGVGEDPRDGAPRPHLGSRLSRIAQVGNERIGERTDRAAYVTPTVIDAGRPSLVFGRVHPDCRRHHADADRLEALDPDLAVTKGLHRRHWIGLSCRSPDLLRFGIARDAYVTCDFVVIRRDVLVRDRPVMRAVMLALDLEIVR